MQTVLSRKNVLHNRYTQLSPRFDTEFGVLWSALAPQGVPCFNHGLLQELVDHHETIQRSGGFLEVDGVTHAIRYSIAASNIPGVFNLGGNIALFKQLIRERDRQGLLAYATLCINVLMPRILHFELPLVTLSLVQGDALGGGMEAVLTSDIVIAERHCVMGFPEILFNLFPGMGAYSMLGRKIGSANAEKVILSGKMYKAEELYEMGVVDVLAEEGMGERALYDYIAKLERRSNGYQAVQRAKHRFNPISYPEMMDITTVWVDAALRLTEKDLKVMDRLVRSQEKLYLPSRESVQRLHAA